MSPLNCHPDIVAQLKAIKEEAHRALDAIDRCNAIDLQESMRLIVELSDQTALRVVEAIEGVL